VFLQKEDNCVCTRTNETCDEIERKKERFDIVTIVQRVSEAAFVVVLAVLSYISVHQVCSAVWHSKVCG
jgi:hypothetical protein